MEDCYNVTCDGTPNRTVWGILMRIISIVCVFSPKFTPPPPNKKNYEIVVFKQWSGEWRGLGVAISTKSFKNRDRKRFNSLNASVAWRKKGNVPVNS